MSVLTLEKSGDVRNMPLPNVAAALKTLKESNRKHAVEIAETLKTTWRAAYARSENRGLTLDYAGAFARASAFWKRYELINRILDPLDPVYSIIKAGTALSTTADLLTHKSGASGQGRILELMIGGEATTSAVNRISVQQVNATLASNGAITPEKFNSRSPAAAGTYGAGNTSALLGNPMLSISLNAFGGFIRWVAAPGEEMYYLNGEAIGVRSASGTSTVSGTSVFEEL